MTQRFDGTILGSSTSPLFPQVWFQVLILQAEQFNSVLYIRGGAVLRVPTKRRRTPQVERSHRLEQMLAIHPHGVVSGCKLVDHLCPQGILKSKIGKVGCG